MPRKADLRGIEQRLTTDGREQYRGTVPHPDNRKRKLRGPWTYSFAEAKGWRVQQLARKSVGEPLVRASKFPTLKAAADAWLDGIESGTILSPRTRERYAPSTVRSYRRAFKLWIAPELGEVRVDRLRRSDVQRFVDTVAAEVKGATARNIVHTLCALYAYLLPRHDELGDPTQRLEKPRKGGPRERYAKPDEIAELLAALPHDLALPYALAFMAGLRHAEIQAMPAASVDLEGGWLDIGWSLDPEAGFKGPKSYAGKRSVPIFDGLLPYLSTQLERLPRPFAPATGDHPGSLLLPAQGARGTRWGARLFGTPFADKCREAWGWKRDDGEWAPAVDEPLKPIGLHEARHSFATALVRSGYDVALVAEWVGHAQASTTLNVYAKRLGRGDAAAVTGRMNAHLLGAGA
jgi:integrase